MSPTSTREALTIAAQRLAPLASARRDAELLLLHILQHDRAWLLTHPEAEITPEQLARFQAALDRRASHEPIQYITGRQEFFGLTLRVTPDVLIPRPETEHLVEAALDRIPANSPARILDVGTGSGAIALAIAAHRPHAAVTAVDTSPAALAIARENASALHLADRIRFVESDLLSAIPSESFDLILSNPPYVPANEPLEPQVLHFEPHQALFAGKSGLDIYRRLIPQAQKSLAPNGWLLMEIGHGQQESLAQLLARSQNLAFVPDLQGIPRVVIAQNP